MDEWLPASPHSSPLRELVSLWITAGKAGGTEPAPYMHIFGSDLAIWPYHSLRLRLGHLAISFTIMLNFRPAGLERSELPPLVPFIFLQRIPRFLRHCILLIFLFSIFCACGAASIACFCFAILCPRLRRVYHMLRTSFRSPISSDFLA